MSSTTNVRRTVLDPLDAVVYACAVCAVAMLLSVAAAVAAGAYWLWTLVL